MRRIETKGQPPRVRWTLLVLLWVWAVLVFVTIDLFLNVKEFDGIRPRAGLYCGMRTAAHKMIGEPTLDSNFVDSPALVRARARARAGDALAHVSPGRRRLEELKREGRNGSFGSLCAALKEEGDPRMRVAAMRVLAESVGPQARDVLLERARDVRETEWVRAEAAYFVGWTGPEAFDVLEELVRSRSPDPVRAGALRGLGRSGSAEAVQQAVACADESSPSLQRAAEEVLQRAVDPKAVPLLGRIATDPGRSDELRIAACRGLGRTRTKEAAEALTALLADGTTRQSVRAAASDALDHAGS